MIKYITLIPLFIYCTFSFAQKNDRILRYSFLSKIVDTMEIPTNTPKHGLKGNPTDQEILSSNLDSLNHLRTENNSNISALLTAQTDFDLDIYPMSTVTKLKGYKNGQFDRGFSGIMIGDRWVLTAAHCLRCCPDSYWFQDSLVTYTSYNGDSSFTDWSNVKNAYVYETFANGKKWKDIALLELEKDLGNNTGWLGLRSISNRKDFNQTFFKFSYPADVNLDSSITYTGDEMQYMYLKMKKTGKALIGSVNKAGYGIFGESGCSLLIQENGLFYSVGVLSYSDRYQHYKISTEDIAIIDWIIKKTQ